MASCKECFHYCICKDDGVDYSQGAEGCSSWADAAEIEKALAEHRAKEPQAAEAEEPKKSAFDKPSNGSRMTPYERTRAAVYATGNRWAIENFNATHG